MKKLMIAACAVAFAAAAQAAQYSWEAKDICTGYLSGEDMQENCSAGTAYLFYSGSSDYTILALTEAIQNGNFLKDGWADKALTSTSVDGMGKFNALSAEGLAGKTDDSFYAVIVASSWYNYATDESSGDQILGEFGGKVDPVQAYITEGFTPAEVKDKGGTPLSWGDGTSLYDGTSGANWYAQAAAVPEPTSGLLLLLGVAGLALRRRRA